MFVSPRGVISYDPMSDRAMYVSLLMWIRSAYKPQQDNSSNEIAFMLKGRGVYPYLPMAPDAPLSILGGMKQKCEFCAQI